MNKKDLPAMYSTAFRCLFVVLLVFLALLRNHCYYERFLLQSVLWFSTVACNATPVRHLWYVNYIAPFPRNVSLGRLWSLVMKRRRVSRKSLNNNDRDQILWARETEHPTQTLVFTKTAGRQPGWGHCYLRSSASASLPGERREPWEQGSLRMPT